MVLDSFVNQTAPNGQLCLADASDAEHADVKRIVEEYQTKNQRIVYKKIENKGIAANTNAAAELATGEYLALADHDDILVPHALYTMGKAILQLRQRGEPDGFLYSDEALFTKSIQRPMVAHFKPDYAPDYLLCCNYICHLAVFRKALWDAIGGERPECDGSQDHDLFLRLAEKTGGAAHVPQVLYYWRVHAGSTSGGADAKPYVAAAAKKALADHLARTGRTGTVEDGLFPSTYRVKWDIVGEPKVSILIPNKDHTEDLEKCLHSIWTKTSWENFEVIVIENNSTDPATFTYYKEARQRYDGLQVVNYPQKGFNFSGINNFGRQYASGDYLLLLNNDVEVRNADWLTELLRQCAHPGGAAICGAELFYPDETLQHAGVVTGLGGYAGHSHKYRKAGGSGYMFRAATVQDFSAVTGACLLVKTSVWDEVGGLDEAFAVAFNDVDFCLRVRDAGCRIAWTPYARLTHYESKSRGGDEKDPVKARRFAAEHLEELGRVEQRHVRAAQHRDVHGVQAAHRQNACENGMDFAVRLQKSGHNTGYRAGQRTGQQPGERMRRRAQHGRDRHAERERAVLDFGRIAPILAVHDGLHALLDESRLQIRVRSLLDEDSGGIARMRVGVLVTLLGGLH